MAHIFRKLRNDHTIFWFLQTIYYTRIWKYNWISFTISCFAFLYISIVALFYLLIWLLLHFIRLILSYLWFVTSFDYLHYFLYYLVIYSLYFFLLVEQLISLDLYLQVELNTICWYNIHKYLRLHVHKIFIPTLFLFALHFYLCKTYYLTLWSLHFLNYI